MIDLAKLEQEIKDQEEKRRQDAFRNYAREQLKQIIADGEQAGKTLSTIDERKAKLAKLTIEEYEKDICANTITISGSAYNTGTYFVSGVR
jgi:hypothetical protein